MRVSANHHPGIRVSDIERSARFYIEALGGHLETKPAVHAGRTASLTMGGTPGARFKVCHIGFDEGIIELFEFLEPVHPVVPVGPAEGGIIHFAFYVDDVAEALERVERAGGKRYWPEIRNVKALDFTVIYVTDPDGHVVELIDVPVEELVRRLVAADPELAPVP
jgi:catechol 2,3-dioxygenase-like lactoylglutathione lyase family enzyme